MKDMDMHINQTWRHIKPCYVYYFFGVFFFNSICYLKDLSICNCYIHWSVNLIFGVNEVTSF